MSRREDRATFDLNTRATLAEVDLDHHEERLDHQDDEQRGQQRLLIGTLVSFSLAAIGIALKTVIDSIGR